MKGISQNDIANTLGISRVTVTKALQNHPDIAKKTRLLVKEKAAELGYIPNHIGRSLSSKRTYAIGVVVPKIAHSFFSSSIEIMYSAARENGFSIIPMISFEDRHIEYENIKTLLSMRVDGIILDVAQNTIDNSSYELIKKSGCKVIFFDRCPADYSFASIVTDDKTASYKLTKLLIENGYKDILFMSGPKYLNISQQRKEGYEMAMFEAQLSEKNLSVDMTDESGYEALIKLSNEKKLPKAVVAVNDPVAVGVYKAAKTLGIRIPEDLAVVGFGNIDAAAMLNPPLTTAKPPIDAMAKAAVNTIIDAIEKGTDIHHQQVFFTELQIRGSA